MRSPDGNNEVVKKKNFSEIEKFWCGWIEIPGHKFLLRGRKFMEPMVFSPNSRFLALQEHTGTNDQISRVVVLDFLTDKQVVAYDEKAERIEDSMVIASLHWTNDSTLRIGLISRKDFAQERVRFWSAS